MRIISSKSISSYVENSEGNNINVNKCVNNNSCLRLDIDDNDKKYPGTKPIFPYVENVETDSYKSIKTNTPTLKT